LPELGIKKNTNSPIFGVESKYKWLCFIIGLLSLVLTIISWYAIDRQASLQIQRLFHKESESIGNHLEQTIESNILLLSRMAKRWELNKGTEYQQWRLDALSLVNDNPSFQAVEWVDSQFYVRWIVPLKGNQQAKNLYLAFETNRKNALMTSRDNNKIMVTNVVKLVQGENGFLVYIPIRIENKFNGFILGVFRVSTLLNTVMKEERFQGFRVSAYNDGQMIYTNVNKNSIKNDKWRQQVDIKLKNSIWSIKVWPDNTTLSALKSHLPTLILCSGIAISIMLCLLIYIIGTLRKRSLEVLQKSKEMEIIYRGTKIISETSSYKKSIESCIRLICKMMGWDAGHAYVIDEVTKDILLPLNVWYMKNSDKLQEFCSVTKNTNFEFGQGLPGRVWRNKEPVWIANIHEDDNFPRAQLTGNLPLKGAFGFPIIIKGKLLAVMEFFQENVMIKDTRLLETFKVLGEQFSRAWEKKQIENELTISEEKSRSVIENANDAVIIINSKGIIQQCNRATSKIFGYDVNILVGKNISFIMHKPEKNNHDSYLNKYLETREKHIIGKGRKVSALRSDNTKIELYLSVNEINLRGKSFFMGILHEITQEMEIQRALEESEAKNRLILQAAGEGVYGLDNKGNTTFVNPAAEHMLGYKAEELIGKGMHVIVHHSYPDGEPYPREKCPMYAAFTDGLVHTISNEVLWRKDGSSFPVEYTSTPIRKNGELMGAVVIFSDISQRKEAERKLFETTTLQKAILDSANFTMISTDTKGIIKTFNSGATRMLGFKASDVINKLSLDIFHEVDEVNKKATVLNNELGHHIQPGFEVFVAKARLGQPDENEWTYIRRDGTSFPVLLSVTALYDRDGNISGFLSIGADITERKKAENAKNEFISCVSHELRTPLTSIRGSIGLILGNVTGEISAQTKTILDIANNNCKHLIRLINDILDIEKYEFGKMSFNKINTLLNPVIEQAIKDNSVYASEFKVKLIHDKNTDDTLSLHLDRDRIMQVLTNLISNAIKYSPPNGIVTVDSSANEKHVCIKVCDLGEGIPHEFHREIFNKFSQADSSSSRKKGGTGLGLNIAKTIVEQHNGKLEFETEINKGTTFFFRLPLDESNQPTDLQ
jgi:PAS domain S-box-containing protein